MAVPGTRMRRVGPEPLQELAHGDAQVGARFLKELLSVSPGQHHESDRRGDQEGQPAALEQLGGVCGEEHESTSSSEPFRR